MGQHIVGSKPPVGQGCLDLLGFILVGAVLIGLIAWINWPR